MNAATLRAAVSSFQPAADRTTREDVLFDSLSGHHAVRGLMAECRQDADEAYARRSFRSHLPRVAFAALCAVPSDRLTEFAIADCVRAADWANLGDRLADYLAPDRIAELDTLDAELEAAAEAAAADWMIDVADEELPRSMWADDVPAMTSAWDAPADPADVDATAFA